MSKALIVDDEVGICKMLSYQLRKQGIDSAVTHTISDGLASYKPEEHSIVFLDINLPDGNGLDIIPVLKKKNTEVMIIVISAYDTKTEYKKAFALGAYEFLGKPFTREMVLQLIEKIQQKN